MEYSYIKIYYLLVQKAKCSELYYPFMFNSYLLAVFEEMLFANLECQFTHKLPAY